jgi:hypothetical protein
MRNTNDVDATKVVRPQYLRLVVECAAVLLVDLLVLDFIF